MTAVRLLAAACALLFLGCTKAGLHEYRSVIDAAEMRWEGRGLPDPGQCLERVDVTIHSSVNAYVDACDRNRPGLYGDAVRHSSGCLSSYLAGGRGLRVWHIHVAPGAEDEDAVVDHELRHALVYCSLGLPLSDPYDSKHSIAEVWR